MADGGENVMVPCMDIDDPIPPLETAEDPFTSPEELRQRWRALMGPLGFSEPLVWVAPVHPDRTLHKALIQVERTLVPNRVSPTCSCCGCRSCSTVGRTTSVGSRCC
ncbi:hypothetical protein GCM10009773_33750 [Williamsia serinedens]